MMDYTSDAIGDVTYTISYEDGERSEPENFWMIWSNENSVTPPLRQKKIEWPPLFNFTKLSDPPLHFTGPLPLVIFGLSLK